MHEVFHAPVTGSGFLPTGGCLLPRQYEAVHAGETAGYGPKGGMPQTRPQMR